ncbi:MAG: hypothetical protein ACLQB1_01325 [Streptosporangiaceae bacterium]
MRASSSSNPGDLPAGAGTRNSGQYGRSVTTSGHSRGSRSGRRSSSPRAHWTQGRFADGGSGRPSSATALSVSHSGEIANLVAARSATSSSSTSSMQPPQAPSVPRPCLYPPGFSAALKRGPPRPVPAGQGFSVTMWNIVTVSLRQRIVPAPLLGRVNSVYRMLGWGLMPVGALAGGFVAHAAGLRAPYVVAGILCALSMLVALPLLLSADRDPADRDPADRD